MRKPFGDLTSHLEIRALVPGDVHAVEAFFNNIVESGLSRSFHPHPFTAETAQCICHYLAIDWYAGCFICGEGADRMVGYVMLRGWDAGYTIPSIGVCVLPEFQGLGLGRMLLNAAILTARLRNSPAMRLKVYPNNMIALALYQSAGFVFDTDLENGQMVGFLGLQADNKATQST